MRGKGPNMKYTINLVHHMLSVKVCPTPPRVISSCFLTVNCSLFCSVYCLPQAKCYRNRKIHHHILSLGIKFKNLSVRICSIFAVLCKRWTSHLESSQEATQHLSRCPFDGFQNEAEEIWSDLFEWKFPSNHLLLPYRPTLTTYASGRCFLATYPLALSLEGNKV